MHRRSALLCVLQCHRLASVLLGLALVGCTPDEPEFLVAPQGTGLAQPASAAVSPTEPDGSSPPAFDFSVPAIAGEQPGADAEGNLGSGCSGLAPPGGALGDGLWAAAIETRGDLLILDVVCKTANGSSNSSEDTRINPSSPDLVVFEVGAAEPSDSRAWLSEPPTTELFWVAINGGVVTSVEALPG